MEKASRRLYGWLALFVLVGLIASLLLDIFNIDTVAIADQTLFHQNTAAIRVVGFFSYFTIWSNILVAYISIAIARSRENSKYFGSLFASALVMITVTGLVYNLVLLPAVPPVGWNWATTILMHVVAPVGFIYLWLVKGPKGYVLTKNTLEILTVSIIYILYTVVHGLSIKQWPYKFLDLTSEGFIVWIISVAVIFGFGILLIRFFARLDKRPTKVKTASHQLK